MKEGNKNPFIVTDQNELENRKSLVQRGQEYAEKRQQIIQKDIEDSSFFKSTTRTVKSRRPRTAGRYRRSIGTSSILAASAMESATPKDINFQYEAEMMMRKLSKDHS